ncbi:hypothetical protein [Amycolatopsis sp. H20-H5]|uniref:hypothetical protein n=1 Tax=Amycolatopsis sp. H20-H5 TaxID=3046309 RepID=UPI002DBF5B8C|nr:hypothetical protein [Amycolatopsis sp. H20-H5]MEC3981193.1 hypothetical protein [Amycolatopsis sp. H20-H5]
MSDTDTGAGENTVEPDIEQATAPAVEPENPHAKSVLTLAAAMQKATLLVVPPVVVAAAVVFLIVQGTPGLVGALVGGVLGLLSSLATIGMMKFSAGLDPMFVMAIALGGYFFKILVLFGALTLLKGATWVTTLSLGLSLLAVILAAAAMDVRAFKLTKIPTIITS